MSTQPILSFNVSVAGNKEFLLEYIVPCQIMPQTRKILTNSIIETYPNISDKKRDGIIHTSYITRCFDERFLNDTSNFEKYMILADRIGFKSVLVHGPESEREYEFYFQTLSILNDISTKYNANIVIEVPSFKKNFVNYIINESGKKEPTEYMKYYLDPIIDSKLEIVLDTAHLYSNGCEVKDMLELFKYYEKNMTFVHLNGNKNKMFTSDTHVPIFNINNNIKNMNELFTYLSTTNLIMIAENSTNHSDRKTWEQFASNYNFKIIEHNDRIAY